MSERGDEASREVDRRHFMLGATNVFGAAALAGWLARPDVGEGSAAPAEGLAEGGLRGLNTSQFVIYQDAPTITAVDGSGENLGDAFYFHAELHLEAGGPVVGHVFGVKTVVKTGTPAQPGVEQRLTHLFFISTDRQHQIVVAGVPDYPVNGAEFEVGHPVVRAVLGGTGAFIGARGQLTSTRHPAGGYTQAFTLLD
ncbi:MAG: hypothetical protein ACREKS_18025 [Candidatus Rokuibacteriota bacterium]